MQEYPLLDRHADAIPAYLRAPEDSLLMDHFSKDVAEVQNELCGYRLMIGKKAAQTGARCTQGTGGLGLEQTDLYGWDSDRLWFAVSTIKSRATAATRLQNWVTEPHTLSRMFDTSVPMLNLPDPLRDRAYESVSLLPLRDSERYLMDKRLDEMCVYCHALRLDGERYKVFFLCARKGVCAWKIEIGMPSRTDELDPAELVVPGLSFGSLHVREI